MKQATIRPHMKTKKVLYLITKATWGGAQRYVYDLSTNLPREDYEPIVAYGTEGRLSNLLEKKRIHAEHLPSLGRNLALISDIQSFFEIVRCIKKEKPDVVHLNSSKAAALGAVAARLCEVQNIIFTVHGWPYKENRNIILRTFIYVASWITALLAHRVIVVSSTDERLALRMWGIKNKTVHIALGITRNELLPPSEGFAKIFGSYAPPKLGVDTRRLITIAELTPNKGIRYGIGAVAELTRRGIDCVYVIVGDGEERARLEKFAVDQGVNDRVYFTGFVTDAEQYLTGFDVFVLPSLKEGTPYVLLEAISAGLPVVTTFAVDSLIEERFKHIVFVPSRDENALADAISELATLPRTHAEESDQFPLSNMLEETMSLYQSAQVGR